MDPKHAAYFCLPKSVQETRVLPWADFTDAWIDSALECAAEVVRRIRAGVFWPPGPNAYERDYDHLFLGDPQVTVVPPVWG